MTVIATAPPQWVKAPDGDYFNLGMIERLSVGRPGSSGPYYVWAQFSYDGGSVRLSGPHETEADAAAALERLISPRV